MKKYFIYFTAIVTIVSMLLTTSCQRVENPSAIGVESEVTFSVSTPDIQTRAYSDGTTAKELTVAVYNGESLLFTEDADMQGTHADVTLTLVNGMNYNIVFWAQAEDAPYTFNPADRTMTVDYNGVLANDENLDAFWKKIEYKSEGAKTQKVELTRPFAQLNIAASDWNEAKKSNVEVTESKVKVENVYSKMDMFTGDVAEGSEVVVEFGMNTTPNSDNQELSGYTIAEGYHWLAMNYLLVDEQALVVVTFNTDCPSYVSEKVYRDIPVKRNYRTNIYGKILTSDTEFNVETKPGFDDEDKDIYVYEDVTYVPVADANAANTAFAAGAKAVAINLIDADAEIILPSTTDDVYLLLPNTDSEVNIKYSTSGDKPAKLYVTIPEGVVSTLNIDATESTVYLNGDVTTLTAGTAQNTLYIVGGKVETLNVAAGNVVIENNAGVNNISRTEDNPDPQTKVFASETATLPENNNDSDIILGYPDFEETENGYNVYTLKGLKEFGDAVNDGNTFSGKQITLKADVDLKDLNWTSIGTEAKPFSGTFEGNGKTIKNLTIIENEAKEGKAFIGFFGYAKNATVKNVVFENVDINIPCLDIDHSQGHIGAVAGSLEGTSTIENVTVKGDVMVYSTKSANGASRVAVVAGGNSYGNVTMKNVHVVANEGSYLIANNNVGALAGQLQGKSVFENCSSNIDVTGTKFFAGGIIGLAAGDQLFTNCHTTGDITITAGREGRAHDQYRVGGIAGGWADGAKNVCTLTGCTYTGVVSGRNSDGSVADPLDYAGFVGRGYTLNGCQGSKVIIDGVEYVQAFNTADEAGIYYIDDILTINSATAFKLFAGKVNSGTYFEGKTIKLGADIDLNNEEWTPIGSATLDHGFMGNFDGNNKTIKNLKMTQLTLDADNYVYAGLFGVTEGTGADNQNYIKNLVIENVTIETTGHIAAAAIAYPYYTVVENITVKGNISIEGGDYTSGVLAYTRRCTDAKNISIEGNSGSSIKGATTVGGVISDIQMNGGLVANYSNFNASGLTISATQNVGGISGIISNQTLDGAGVENVTINCEDVRKGIVSGALGGLSTIKNISYTKVEGATKIVGATYDTGGEVEKNGDEFTPAN